MSSSEYPIHNIDFNSSIPISYEIFERRHAKCRNTVLYNYMMDRNILQTYVSLTGKGSKILKTQVAEKIISSIFTSGGTVHCHRADAPGGIQEYPNRRSMSSETYTFVTGQLKLFISNQNTKRNLHETTFNQAPRPVVDIIQSSESLLPSANEFQEQKQVPSE